MIGAGRRPTANKASKACEESGQWELALLVFDQLPAATVIGVNAGIAAAGRGQVDQGGW